MFRNERSTVFIFFACCMLLVACPENGDGNGEEDAGNPDTPEGLTQPFEVENLGWLLHVTGRGPGDIYVAGGTPDLGALKHYDGQSWTDVELPEGTPLLNWIQLFDDGTMTVVGNGGTILHHDGSAWSKVESGTEEDLWGVWGESPADVWAVGGRGRAEGQATILRDQGGGFEAVPIPELERTGVNAFFKVWGTDAGNVYIVGQDGAVVHWDGEELLEEFVGTSRDLISLWGTSPENVLLVGGRGNGVVSRWDGSEWHTESISPTPGINGIWMLDEKTAWLAGVRGTLRRLTIEDDGSFSYERTRPVTELDLHAVWATEGYGLLTVGGNFGSPDGPFEAVVLRQEEDWK